MKKGDKSHDETQSDAEKILPTPAYQTSVNNYSAVLLLGIVLTNYFRIQHQKELAVYAERSKNNCLKSVDEILDTFSRADGNFFYLPLSFPVYFQTVERAVP